MGPFAYATGGSPGFGVVLLVGLSVGVVSAIVTGLAWMSFVSGLSTGLAVGVVNTIPIEGFNSVGLVASFVAAATTGLVASLGGGDVPAVAFEGLPGSGTGLSIGIAVSGSLILNSPEAVTLLQAGDVEFVARFAPFILVLGFVGAYGFPFGFAVGQRLMPSLLAFADLWLYLREMSKYLGAFALGYAALAFQFASLYGVAWQSNRHAFAGDGFPAAPTFWDFFYFSAVTIATLGYGDIRPVSLVARMLAAGEVILGVGWITVVLAIVMVDLQPRFAQIARKRREDWEFRKR